MISPLSLSLLCRIGQEWSVSLSYFGWPWLWFAVSLNKYATLPLLTLLVQQKSFAVLLLQHQKLIMSKQMFLFLKKKKCLFSPNATIISFLALELQHMKDFSLLRHYDCCDALQWGDVSKLHCKARWDSRQPRSDRFKVIFSKNRKQQLNKQWIKNCSRARFTEIKLNFLCCS